MRIYTLKNGSSNENERLELSRLLIKMGYTVRLGKEKDGTKSTFKYFVEYTEGGILNE